MTRNKRFSSILALSLMLASPAFAEDSKIIIARVNGEAITKADLDEEMKQLPPQLAQVPVQAIYPQLLEQLVLEKTVMQAADKAGMQKDAVVLERVKDAQGKIAADEYLKREVKKNLSDKELKAAYDDYKKNFKGVEEVRASHILVKTEAEAADLIKQIKGGADFTKLATEKSEDKAAAKQGGDLGYFTKKDMVESFANAAFAMKPGDVSTKPVKSEFGYHVIKVVDKRTSQPESFDKLKPQLEAKMSQKVAQDTVKGLVSKATVERFNIDGTPMAAAPAAKAE